MPAKACALSDIPSAGREKYDPTEVGRVLCFDFSTEDSDLTSSMRLTLRRAAHVPLLAVRIRKSRLPELCRGAFGKIFVIFETWL